MNIPPNPQDANIPKDPEDSQRSSSYETLDTIISDGPIIYGTGLNIEGRAKAWEHFFTLMVRECLLQQGKDALELKLMKRCQPGMEICSVAIDAELVGIGGIQEARKVVVLVTFYAADQNRQTSRTVCTWPDRGVRVCRDWDTGKLIAP